ncbi:MAG: 3-dehydroquinate synthase [Candidatus Omnitrophota bacterium]
MKTISIRLQQGLCRIHIGKNILGSLGRLCQSASLGPHAVVVTTPPIKKLFSSAVEKSLRPVCAHVVTVPDTEKSKSASMAMSLIKKITPLDKGRGLFLVALGGGVVGDLTGFVASIYKRGVPYLQIPTTLLAQIDSSIGGKTAVDTTFGKNLVGAFYQPRFVLSDIKLLSSLPVKELRSGLAEAVKYGLIKDPALFTLISKNARRLLKPDSEILETLVRRCAEIKAKVVRLDEFDKKDVRIVLNFGHTVGHAVEAASRFQLSHGEGVSIGMACACEISERLGWLKPETREQAISLLETIGLPTRIPKNLLRGTHQALVHDKKFLAGKNRFVLLEDIGRTKIAENIPGELIRQVLRARSISISR